MAGGVCDMPSDKKWWKETETQVGRKGHNLVMGEQRADKDKDKEAAYFQFRCVSIDR